MSIQLKGNDDSSFSNDVNIQDSLYAGTVQANGGANSNGINFRGVSSGSETFRVDTDGSAMFSSGIDIGTRAAGNDYSASEPGRVLAYRSAVSSDEVWVGGGGSTTTSFIRADGSAEFAGDIQVTQTAGTERTIQVGTLAAPGKVSIRSNGNAYFAGTVTQGNTFLALDTGGTLDVKERLQNTQAILYRLKAALIQPDADVNTLRQRLLEALDILTSDGDES